MDTIRDESSLSTPSAQFVAETQPGLEDWVREAQRLSQEMGQLRVRACETSQDDPNQTTDYRRLAEAHFQTKQRLLNDIGRAIYAMLLASAIAATKNPTDAVEVAETALERVLTRLDDFAWEGPFTAWCCGFVKWGWRERLRATIRYRERTEQFSQLAAISPQLVAGFGTTAVPQPDEVACSESEVQWIRGVLGTLPADCAERLLLVGLESKTCEEAGEKYGESPRQAKDRYRYCRELAKKKLAKHRQGT